MFPFCHLNDCNILNDKNRETRHYEQSVIQDNLFCQIS